MPKPIQKCPFHFVHKTPLEIPQMLVPETPAKVGVIMVNLGTPDDTSVPAVRRYLKEFLSDRRVIGACAFLWNLLLTTVILTVRPSKTAKLYQSIWKRDTNESPLRYYTRRQAELVGAQLKNNKEIIVEWAMRYGTPSLESVIDRLHQQGCTKLVILPLYPQYAASTTASVNDQVFRILMRMRWQPSLRIIHPYETHDAYIHALKQSIIDHLKTLSWTPEKLIVSFHGIPVDYVERGDPYHYFCQQTFQALQNVLPKGTPDLMLTFQSRFGPKEWLKPYTDQTLEQLGASGTKKIALMAPGFASDCIETLEELQREGKETFINSGGTHFTQIPCLNDSAEAIHLYTTLISENLHGWTKVTS